MEVAKQTLEPDLLNLTPSAPGAYDAVCLDTIILRSRHLLYKHILLQLNCILANFFTAQCDTNHCLVQSRTFGSASKPL